MRRTLTRTVAILLAALLLRSSASGVAIAREVPPPGTEAQGVSRPERLQPGAVYVFFDDDRFGQPGSHGLEKQIQSHGLVTEIRSHGVERQINLDIEGITGFSKLWLGKIKLPTSGEITFLAEADDGVRLYIGEKPILDGWKRDGDRQGKVSVTGSQTLPLRVEYIQAAGDSYLRLYWQWDGQPKVLVPPSAFWHSQKDLQIARAIVDRKALISPENAPPVPSVPAGDEEFKSSIYQPRAERGDHGGEPIRLGIGPHLLIDDYLIEFSKNVRRKVHQPKRHPAIDNPIVNGRIDRNKTPFTTALRDPKTGRFRLWYNTGFPGRRYGFDIALLESIDGIDWMRPHKIVMESEPGTVGCAVIDDGVRCTDSANRFKMGWFQNGGLKVATSPDGVRWNLLRPDPVLLHNHDINNIWYDTLRNHYVAILSVSTRGPNWEGDRRCTMQSTSKDLINWEHPWYILTPNDKVDKGKTQFYAMQGHLIRGGLWIGLVKVLRDDLQAPETPEGAFGIGYTTLAWTRDGQHWVRDPEPFFEPDPSANAWDHALAWMDCQLPIGDEVYIYYGGYKNGHKMGQDEERQIGLARMPRDRYVSRDADAQRGLLRTRPIVLAGRKMTVNANVEGELRVRILDAAGKPIPGFDTEDCKPVRGDSLAHGIEWKGSLAEIREKPVQMEFVLRNAHLYGFDFTQ